MWLVLVALSIFLSFMIFFIAPLHAQPPQKNSLYYQNLTGDEPDSDKSRWDRFYEKQKGFAFGKEPSHFLKSHIDMIRALRPTGTVLDIAMGEGRNAVYMAGFGYNVEGVDISKVAIQHAKQLAREKQVKIRTTIADLEKIQFEENKFDIILVFYYLQRSLALQIQTALKKGGVLVFVNQTLGELKYNKSIDRKYLLQNGELKTLFSQLKTIKYEEIDDGKEAIAMLIAQK